MEGVIYCDGGSNQFGSIYCLFTENSGVKWVTVRRFVKKYNVIQIEYLALIAALEKCSPSSPLIYTDNLRIANEITMPKLPLMASKNKLLWKKARRILKKKQYARVKWKSRDQNLAGIYLEEILWKKKEEKYGIPREELQKMYDIINERKRLSDNH